MGSLHLMQTSSIFTWIYYDESHFLYQDQLVGDAPQFPGSATGRSRCVRRLISTLFPYSHFTERLTTNDWNVVLATELRIWHSWRNAAKHLETVCWTCIHITKLVMMDVIRETGTPSIDNTMVDDRFQLFKNSIRISWVSMNYRIEGSIQVEPCQCSDFARMIT